MLDGLVLSTCVLARWVVKENWHWSKSVEGPDTGDAIHAGDGVDDVDGIDAVNAIDAGDTDDAIDAAR